MSDPSNTSPESARPGNESEPEPVRAVTDTLDTRDPEAECARIIEFIREKVTEASADGVVVNISGGIDSTVAVTLAVEALGPDRVYGLVLPCNKTGSTHARDAEVIADTLEIESDTVHLQPLFTQFRSSMPDTLDLHDEPEIIGNLIARFRMAMVYLAANTMNRLVLGTTNRSERLLGYFTKYGDGAADLLPLGHLYKTNVRTLATTLDVPNFVVEKRPTPGFFPGHYDQNDLGASYEVIDAVLSLSLESNLGDATIAAQLDVDEETVARLRTRYERTQHRRSLPVTPAK